MAELSGGLVDTTEGTGIVITPKGIAKLAEYALAEEQQHFQLIESSDTAILNQASSKLYLVQNSFLKFKNNAKTSEDENQDQCNLRK